LSRLRAALVKGATLAEIGRELKLEPHVILGAGELRSGGSQRASILANTVEAVIGAVFLDGGFSAAEACVSRLFAERLRNLPDAASLKDPKTRLQEWLQGRGVQPPSYEVESISGEPHRQSFVVLCQVPEFGRAARGQGRSRRRAEQDAAEQLLSLLSSDEE
jgi:ribonuclease-3